MKSSTSSHSLARRALNRLLHSMARSLPGSRSLRPLLHRWRGVRVGANVFIGDEVYIENEYPERVEIESNVEVGLRTAIIAHLRGPGRVVIKQGAWIGAGCIVSSVCDRVLTIGEGAVVGAGSVITSDIPDHSFVAPAQSQRIGTASVSLATASSYRSFFLGLRPIRRDQGRLDRASGALADTGGSRSNGNR